MRGFSSLWVSDHIVVPVAGSPLPSVEMIEPVTTLAYVAAVTKTIRLATSVLVVPYRNPIHLAKELATVWIGCAMDASSWAWPADGWSRSFACWAPTGKGAAHIPMKRSGLMRTYWKTKFG